MSALDAVRKKFGNLQAGTAKTAESPSGGFGSSSDRNGEKFLCLAPKLERRIRAMAIRWSYETEELSETLDLAQHDPDGWLRAVALDERRFGSSACPLTREEIEAGMRNISAAVISLITGSRTAGPWRARTKTESNCHREASRAG